MKTRLQKTIASVAMLALIIMTGTVHAVMVSGWEPVGDNVVTLTFSDDAGNMIVGKIRQAIFWELGTEENPKFVKWDDTATFTVKAKDGKEYSLPNAEVKSRIKTVYLNFSPDGKLHGDLLELVKTDQQDRKKEAPSQTQAENSTVKGTVSSVSIRTGEPVIPNLNAPVVNLAAKGSSSTVVIQMSDAKAKEYVIAVPQIVELQGFTDLKGKHEMMGGLLILSDLQKRLVGKDVELKCNKAGEKEGTEIYSVSGLQIQGK